MQIAIKRISAIVLVCSWWLPGLNAQQSELQSDRAHRDFAIRWPAAYDPSVAPVFSHNELLIHTGCHRAFARLADAVDWPNWLILVKDVNNETLGNTGQGALYRLKIFNSPMQSRIVDYVGMSASAGFLSALMRLRVAMGITMLGTSSRRLQIAWSSPKKQASVPVTSRIPSRAAT